MSRSNVCKLSTKFVLLGPGLCGSKSPSASSSMFDEPRISRPHSHHLRAELRHSMFCQDLLTLTDRIGINTLALGARLRCLLLWSKRKREV